MAELIKYDENKNFCRVFRLPLVYPSDFCFGGGHEVTMRIVDWFNPVWPEAINDGHFDWAVIEDKLRDFVAKKPYVNSGRDYLVLTDFGKSLVITGEGE